MAFVFETYLPLNSLIFFFFRFQCRESNAGYEDVKMMTDKQRWAEGHLPIRWLQRQILSYYLPCAPCASELPCLHSVLICCVYVLKHISDHLVRLPDEPVLTTDRSQLTIVPLYTLALHMLKIKCAMAK